MDHRIPRVGVVICLVLALGALITFIFLNNRFQGPNPVGFLCNPYELTVRFKDNKTLPTKQAVLFQGIEVGTVTEVKWDTRRRESESRSRSTTASGCASDAVIRIGYRSLLGDPYLAVDSRGSAGQPELKSGDEVTRTDDDRRLRRGARVPGRGGPRSRQVADPDGRGRDGGPGQRRAAERDARRSGATGSASCTC